jgi:uncharacterized repeat protein (TIGR03803 family)
VHSFNGTRGKNPQGALVLDASGNLYGATSAGGAYGGVAFMLSRNSAGTWVETVLHNFGNTKDKDGTYPQANLILDSAGNLYGITLAGGSHNQGTVYKLSPAGGGKWTETILHSFSGGTSVNTDDGAEPEAGLLFDSAGNLYGTTAAGGNYGQGTAFELSPASGGGWTEKIIWSFGNGTDGANPEGSLVSDSAGNLYGTTERGGVQNSGTVYELSEAGGTWTDAVLHSFGATPQDGLTPMSTLAFDASGNLYGTTQTGGSGYGTVFELSSVGGGNWTETVLHNFASGSDGSGPGSEQLVLDAAGNLYGTTSYGGSHTAGTVFELSPSLGGWTETVIHSFGGVNDGEFPYAGVILDSAGNLYGATLEGGNSGSGIVYEITP